MPLDIAFLDGKRAIAALTVGVYAGASGTLLLGVSGERLSFLTVLDGGADSDVGAMVARHFPKARIERDDAAVMPTGQRIDAYNADPHAVSLAIGLAGTPFQHSVWRALLSIPAGRAETYGDLAARIGRAGAARAVGAACAANPVALIVPCHRVVGAGGALTGFSAGAGVATKAALLRAEAASDIPVAAA